jgi:hypothetical protein
VDLTQLTEKHGKKAALDLLNIIFINNWKQPDGGWRMFCLRHGVVTRNTKTVKPAYAGKNESYWYTINGIYERQQKPEIHYRTKLRNGSGKVIFDVDFTPEQLEEWKASHQ